MCIGDKKYCKKKAITQLFFAQACAGTSNREYYLALAAAWMVMWAGAK